MGDHCYDVRTCEHLIARTFKPSEDNYRGVLVTRCSFEHCASTHELTAGMLATFACDDETAMHADCWRAYDKAWRAAHRALTDDQAAAAEDRYFRSLGA